MGFSFVIIINRRPPPVMTRNENCWLGGGTSPRFCAHCGPGTGLRLADYVTLTSTHFAQYSQCVFRPILANPYAHCCPRPVD